MNLNTLSYLLFFASLIFTLLTLIGYHYPRLVLARYSTQVPRRYGIAALLCYLFMALVISVQQIDHRSRNPHPGQTTNPATTTKTIPQTTK